MRDQNKTKTQLIAELEILRQRVSELENSQAVNKQAEAALRESERRYRLLAENVTDVIWTMDLNLHSTYTSPSVRRLRGFDAEDAMSQSLEEAMTPESLEIAFKALEEELVKEKLPDKDLSRSRTLEFEILRKNGSTIWVETTMTFLRDACGQPTEILGVTRDITDRKRAEQARYESEQRFSILSAAAFEGIVISDRGRVIDVNKQLAAMLGYEPSEVVGIEIEKFVAPESLELVMQHIKSKSEEPYEHLALRKDRSTFPVEIRAKSLPYNGHVLRVTAIRDITERKRVEGILRLQSTALEAAANSIVITDLDGSIQWANPAFTKLTGYSLDEALGKNPRDLIRSGVQDKAFYKDMWDTILSGQVWRGELVNRRKDGALYNEEMTLTSLRDENGEVTHFIAIKQDINDRIQADQAIRESEARYRHTLDLMMEGCQIIGFNWRYLYLNDVADEHNRRPKEELLGKKYTDIWPGIESTRLFSVLRRCMEERVSQSLENEFTFLDGSTGWFELRIYPVPEGVVILSIDITDRKQTEQALHDNQKRLAGIIDSAMDAIITLDAEQRITLFNLAAEKLFGCPAEAVVGQTLDHFIPKQYRNAHREHIRIFGETGLTSRSMGRGDPITCLRADGDEFFAEITISQVELAGQKIYTAILRDITRRIQAEQALKESEEHFRTLFEHLPIPAFTKNRDGQYTSSNAENQRYWNVNPIGKSDLELLPPKVADALRAVDLSVLETGEALTEERLFENTSLGKRQFISRKVPLRDGSNNIVGILGANVDITERKQAEQALSRRIDELGALYKTTLEIISVHDLSSLLNSIVKRAVALLGGTGGGLYLCDLEMEQARCVVSYQTQDDYTGTVLRFGEGAAGKVAATGEPLIIDDYRTWDGRAKVFEEKQPFNAMVSAPMLWKGRVTGVVHVLHDSEKRKFTQEDLKLLISFANQAAIAVENTRLLDETQRRLEQLSTLRHIDQAISSSLDLRIILNILLGHILQLLEVDAAAVLLYRPELQMLEFVAGEGFHTQALQFTNLRLGEGFAGQAVLEQRTVHVSDLGLLETGFLRSPKFHNENFVAYIGVPLIAKGNVVGVLEIYHRQIFNPDLEWMTFLETLAGQAAIAIDNVRLFEDLQASNMQLRQAYDSTIEGWAQILEMRHMETEGHSHRTVNLTIELARKMGIEEKELEHIRWGTLLHDIGKMGIPDAILQKPDQLTESEWEIVRQHPGFAKKWLSPIVYLKEALDIPYCHHEKWDGTGYPRGLKGQQIPLAARVFAVVDVWDTLQSDRPYRNAWPQEKVMVYVQEQSGKHFDPEIVEAFISLLLEKNIVERTYLFRHNKVQINGYCKSYKHQ
ncbi:MAG: PAS domain S-box protein [Anaerolineales bacterium]|jgi:PAS domain S-box-containing protein